MVSSEVIPGSNKTIDDHYLHLPFLVPKYQLIDVLQKKCSEILLKIHWKTPAMEFWNFSKIGLQQHGRTENLLKATAFSTRTELPTTKNKDY